MVRASLPIRVHRHKHDPECGTDAAARTMRKATQRVRVQERTKRTDEKSDGARMARAVAHKRVVGAGRTRAATGVQWNSSIPDFFEDKGGRMEVLVKVRCRNRLSPVIML